MDKINKMDNNQPVKKHIDNINSEDPSMQKEELERMLMWIKHYRDKMSYESYSFIKNTLHKLDFPVPYLIVPENKFLYRCRPHTEGQDYFKTIDEISCRRDIFCIADFGRANEPVQSVFYCSDDPQIALYETSATTRKNKDLNIEIITTGVWQVQEDFEAGNLIVSPFENNIHEINESVKKTYENFQMQLQSYGFQNEYIALFTFFANEFLMRNSDSKHYLTTTAFANFVFSSHFEDGKKLCALIYPSAIYPWKGMNLAIHTDLIKNDKLLLKSAKRITRKKNPKGEYEKVEEIICKEVNQETREIIWS